MPILTQGNPEDLGQQVKLETIRHCISSKAIGIVLGDEQIFQAKELFPHEPITEHNGLEWPYRINIDSFGVTVLEGSPDPLARIQFFIGSAEAFFDQPLGAFRIRDGDHFREVLGRESIISHEDDDEGLRSEFSAIRSIYLPPLMGFHFRISSQTEMTLALSIYGELARPLRAAEQ